MVRHVGANMETVRKRNRSAILKFINDGGPVSRKDLAEVTGLTPAAVTQICTDLLAEKILVETGMAEESQGAGRKKILLDVNYDVAYVLGINIETEQTIVALGNLKGEKAVIKKLHTDSQARPEEFLQQIIAACNEMLEEHPKAAKKLAAVGVGITGLVDKENGISTKAYGIWNQEVDVRGVLSEAFAVPVYVENNVNAFAIAELFYGIGKAHENLMLIKWGPGVGCAMIIDQEVYEGRHRKAAELGHFIVDPKGDMCSCGRRGCLETKISFGALNRIQSFTVEDFERVFETDAGFEEALDMFARTIVNSATVMAPNRIIISGSLFQSEKIRNKLIENCGTYDDSWGEGRVLYSVLADKENYIGPIALCAKHILF